MIIATMVTTLMSVMVMGAGKLVTNEVRANARFRDEQVAYYAAEAGIERGMALLNITPDLADDASDTDPIDFPDYNFSDSGQSGGKYDLSLWRQVASPEYKIAKDQTIELNLDDVGSRLSLQYTGAEVENTGDNTENPTCPRDVCVYLQADQYQDSSVRLSETPVSQDLFGKEENNFVSDVTHKCVGGWKEGATLNRNAGAKTLRIRPYVTLYKLPEKLKNDTSQKGISNYTATNKLSPDKSCLYHLTFQGASLDNPGIAIDQGYVSIRSIGRYRNVKVALEAKLSNMSNQALEIFDYVIYAGENLDVK